MEKYNSTVTWYFVDFNRLMEYIYQLTRTRKQLKDNSVQTKLLVTVYLYYTILYYTILYYTIYKQGESSTINPLAADQMQRILPLFEGNMLD